MGVLLPPTGTSGEHHRETFNPKHHLTTGSLLLNKLFSSYLFMTQSILQKFIFHGGEQNYITKMSGGQGFQPVFINILMLMFPFPDDTDSLFELR